MEIKNTARTDPVTAADGVVCPMERIWPAFQHIDTSSGALGGAANWAQDELLPIVAEAPARTGRPATNGWTGSGRPFRMTASVTCR